MPVKIQMSDFGLDTKNINSEVEGKYSSLSDKSKTSLEKIYGSAYDFLAVLYHLRFIKKLEKSEIATKLGITPPAVHIKLYDLSWQYSSDWEENKSQRLKAKNEIGTILSTAKVEASELNVDNLEHEKLNKALSSSVKIKEATYSKIGVKTREEYIRILYYLIFIEKCSVKQIMPIFNQSHSAMQTQLRSLGLNLQHKEGMSHKKERKSQNYEKSIRSGKKTRTKAQLENFSTGSKNQDYVRSQLVNFIYDYLDSKKYEVVIGMSDTGILGVLEIDIPIVIYDVEEKQIYRFAVEYNGGYFHSTERDENKKAVAENKGWFYLEVIETSSAGYSNNSNLLDPVVHTLCQNIKDLVEPNKPNN